MGWTPEPGSALYLAARDLSCMPQCRPGRLAADSETSPPGRSVSVKACQPGADWQMAVADARCKLTTVHPPIVL